MSGANKILLRYNGPGTTESPTEVTGRVEPSPTTIDEGLAEFKGRSLDILPTDGVVWCNAPESTTQSLTELRGGCNAMVLKELASDCWSQPGPFQGAQPGAGASVACWYIGS